ncbi:unnamed protein product [Caenorhabditis bovis]|uniref:phosphatidylinositol-3,5-bisphosphate 3-phosphatase n=1 Tax=Caenorhabditis bovis TaxID=2654633 RepID=A0A8S1F5W4_9PELO|nr:unnamed protein product [Caenorhabditis bovis]
MSSPFSTPHERQIHRTPQADDPPPTTRFPAMSTSCPVETAYELKLLRGEAVIREDKNVMYIGPFGRVKGRILVTTYRMTFVVNDNRTICEEYKLDIPLGQIAKIEKFGYASSSRKDDSYGFQILCKDYRTYRFASDPSTHSRRDICETLNIYAFPLSYKLKLFAFAYRDSMPKPSIDGWKVYSAMGELERMGVGQCKFWRIIDINKEYKFAETYPSLLAIPTASADEGNAFLKKIGEFRSRQRIPVLSWFDRKTLATITRSSQPLCGVTGRKNLDDEAHLRNIREANAHCSELQIYDARPNVNATVNKAKGGGYEENYELSKLTFLDIHNIHVVRESMKKFVQLLSSSGVGVDEKHVYKMIDETKWLMHIASILDASARIVHNIATNRQSVLVHCSDGWDRTAQLTSLAMIQLDRYYRTIEGFIVVIEKEWCSFGHKFAQRYGHGDENSSDSERSPVFPQFVECVWQIMQQFPTCFEFNSRFLIAILDEMYACRFGTFLYNSEKARIAENKCHETTISLWSYILENRQRFENPLYKKAKNHGVISVNPSYCRLEIWTEYYARSNPHVVTPHAESVQLLETRPSWSHLDFFDEIRNLENILYAGGEDSSDHDDDDDDDTN